MVAELLATWTLDEGFLSNALARARAAGLASFDIFDTALTRAFDSPADVFAEVEARLVRQHGRRARGFAHAREDAEREARKSQDGRREDITHDDVYRAAPACLPGFTAWEEAKRVELEVEGECLAAVPDVLELTRRLGAEGIPFIFVSDMYLPGVALEGWLTRAGYTGWRRLFVSSEIGKTKGSGAVWEVVKREFPGKILHIGDDGWSDVERPRALGLETMHYTRARSARRTGARLTPAVTPFSRLQRHEELTRRRRVEAKPPPASEAWKSLGRTLGGTVLGAFVRWLGARAQAHGIKRLYFCARDGYLLQRAWDTSRLGESLGIESRYLYVSRAVLNIAGGRRSSSPTRLDDALVELLATTNGKTTARLALQRAGLEGVTDLCAAAGRALGSLDRPIADERGVMAFREVIRAHAAPIYAALEGHADRTLRYLRQEGLEAPGPRALVDMGWHGTMQRAVNELVRGPAEPVLGFYYGLWPGASRHRYRAGVMEACFGSEFLPIDEQPELQESVAILEELHTAPEGSTLGFEVRTDGRLTPRLAASPAELAQHEASTRHFQEGALETVAALFSGNGSCPIRLEELDREAALAALGAVVLSPTIDELELIGKLGHSATFDHATLPSLVTPRCPVARGEAEALFFRSEWRTGQALAWLRSSRGADQELTRAMAARHLQHLGERRLRAFR